MGLSYFSAAKKYPNASQYTTKVISFASGIDQSKYSNILSTQKAYFTKNFSFKSGALLGGYGFIYAPFTYAPTEQTEPVLLEEAFSLENAELFFYKRFDFTTNQRDDALLIVTQNYDILYLSLQTKQVQVVASGVFTSMPTGFCYRLNSDDVFIFSNTTDGMFVLNHMSLEHFVDAPDVTSMCVHYERCFACSGGEAQRVWFSEDLDPTNWNVSLDEAGFIDLLDERGRLLKVVSFHDYVYIFREYGISRLSAIGEQTSFSVTHLYNTSGRIYAKTVAVSGDRILFLAEDGLYSFDGVDTTCILKELAPLLKVQNSKEPFAIYSCGEYRLFTHILHENAVIPCLFCVNPVSKEYMLTCDVDIHSMASVQTDNLATTMVLCEKEGTVCVMELNESGSLDGAHLEKVWQSGFTDFGIPEKVKTLRKITLTTLTDITITLLSETSRVVYTLHGNASPQTIVTLFSGKRMSFTITTTSHQPEISNMQLTLLGLER